MINEISHLRKMYNKYYRNSALEENGSRSFHMNTIDSEREHSETKSHFKGLKLSEEKSYSRSFFINNNKTVKKNIFPQESISYVNEWNSKPTKSSRPSTNMKNESFIDLQNSTRSLVKAIEERITHLKKKLTENYKIDLTRFRCLSPRIKILIFSYLGEDIKNLIRTDNIFHQEILEIYRQRAQEFIVEKFNQNYKGAFHIVDKKIIYSYNKNFKVDLALKILITLPRTFTGKTVTFSNKVEYNSTYTNAYVFDYKDQKTPRRIWVMREYTKFHSNDYDKSFTQSILEFSHSDMMEISVNILSGIGMVQFDSFQWLPMTYTSNVIQIGHDRVCEFEFIKSKWTKVDISNIESYLTFLAKTIDNLETHFDNINVYVENIGFTIIKITARAIKEGRINTKLGIEIKISPRNSTVMNEVKRRGLVLDLFNYISLRVGDEIILYLSYSFNLFKF